jgi:hypothetical protein
MRVKRRSPVKEIGTGPPEQARARTFAPPAWVLGEKRTV